MIVDCGVLFDPVPGIVVFEISVVDELALLVTRSCGEPKPVPPVDDEDDDAVVGGGGGGGGACRPARPPVVLVAGAAV